MLKLIPIFLILLAYYELAQSSDICGDWTPFKENKCLKVLEKKATEEEGLKNCVQLDGSSTLVTIHNKGEQEFLNNFLSKYTNISLNVWIGMKYKNNSYEWLDGTDSNFSNWGEDAVKDGSLPCVEMSLESSNKGQWTDQSCKKAAVVVCQRELTNIDSNDLKKVVENLVKVVQKQQNEINSFKSGSVPIGFIYTQLPKQSAPEKLWPNTNWTEVTEEYAGLFFRAEGNDTAPFGHVQQANYSRISNIEAWSSEMDGWRDDRKHGPLNIQLDGGKWAEIKPGGLLYWLKFYVSASDSRPQNTAVKIWKRID